MPHHGGAYTERSTRTVNRQRDKLWVRGFIMVSAGRNGDAEQADSELACMNNFSGLWA